MNPKTDDIEDTPEARAERLVSTIVAGRWYIEGVLGVGGMATVYKAVHYRNGRKVALKILHEELSGVKEVRERFFLEAYASNRVGHPGVVMALDDGVLPDKRPYLVMEYLHGETVEDMWKRSGQRLPAVHVCLIFEELLDILHTAHQRGIIHRDIKPENIFITESQQIKLLDFGIAQLRSQVFSTKTRAGSAMGTPAFMPPEQARGRWEDVDSRSDLFSVAATMYVLMSGVLLHQAQTNNECLLAAMTHQALPLREVAPFIPKEIAEVVDRGVSFHKKDRFASAEDMRVALRAARLAVSESDTKSLADFPAPVSRPDEHPSFSDVTHQPVVKGSTDYFTSLDVDEFARAKRRKNMYWMAAASIVSACVGFGLVRAEAALDSGELNPWSRPTVSSAQAVVLNLADEPVSATPSIEEDEGEEWALFSREQLTSEASEGDNRTTSRRALRRAARINAARSHQEQPDLRFADQLSSEIYSEPPQQKASGHDEAAQEKASVENEQAGDVEEREEALNFDPLARRR